MQEKKKILKKLIAFYIVFLLIFFDCLPILTNYSFGADNFDNAINVIGYFSSGSVEKANSLDCDVNENNLNINFEIDVKEKGYLKSGYLKLDDNSNFKVKDNQNVQIKDNQIKLQELTQGQNQKVVIPIGFVREKIFPSDYFSRVNKIIFSGVYVDNDGIEHKIEKNIDLSLSWKEQTSTKIEYQLIKNIDYEKDGAKGKILQIETKISGNVGENNLPIKNTEMKMGIPQVNGMKFESAEVQMLKLAYTQGRDDNDCVVADAKYRVEENNLFINVENNEVDGKVYNSGDEDKFVITLLYTGEKVSDDVIPSTMEYTVNSYSGNSEPQKIDVSYDLTKPVGKIVQYTKENNVDPISRGYLMANSENEKYEITYNKKDILNISRADLISSMEIIDGDEYFSDGQNAYHTDNAEEIMSVYKKMIFSKENLMSILGESGKVQILNLNDEVIAEFDCSTDADENGNFDYEFQAPISKVKVRTSEPIADGTLSVFSTKVISKLSFTKDQIELFTSLVNSSHGIITYKEGATDDLGVADTSIDILPTSSSAKLEISQKEISATVKNENVNFKIRLNNSEDTSDLYENPVFEIRLPQAIAEAQIKNMDLFYANDELKIANVENLIDGDNQIIRVTLSGMQTSYNLNKETNGTIISFDADLSVKEFTGNVSEMVEMYYYNEASNKYLNETDWRMIYPSENVSYLKNGYDGVQISYKAPEELINGQSSETKDDEEKVSSAKNGEESNLIQEGAEAKLATMGITVMNNTSKQFSKFKILGRIPFIGNKDITTGEDLGTTVDTILDTEISSVDSEVPYTVYYSENGDATEDLNDENNGWHTDFYKMGGVKSYLIVLNEDYVLESGAKLNFQYDYVIPANLKSGDAFFGTYATYYDDGSNKISESSAKKIGYETRKKATLETSIRLLDDKVEELSDAKFEITIKNTSDVDAENIETDVPIVDGLIASSIECDDDVTAGEDTDNNLIKINIDKIEKNSEKKVYINCGTFRLDENLENVKLNLTGKADNVDEFSAESKDYSIERANLRVYEGGIYEQKYSDEDTDCVFNLTNSSEDVVKNIHITKKLAKEITVKDINKLYIDNANVTYNQETGILDISIDELQPYESLVVTYVINLSGNGLTGNRFEFNSETVCTCDDESKNINFSKEIAFDIPDLQVDLVNKQDVGYVSSNNEFEYVFRIKNNSNFDVVGLPIYVEKSGNLGIDLLNYTTEDGEETGTSNAYDFDSANLFDIPMGGTLEIRVPAKVISGSDKNAYVSLKMRYGVQEFSSPKYYSLVDSQENMSGHCITGSVFVDGNNNQQVDDSDNSVSGAIVNLYNSTTNEIVGSAITDISGRYLFENLADGNYYVKFNYDNSKYNIGNKKENTFDENASSVINVGDNCITDNISIVGNSVASVDLPLVEDNTFDLKLDASVVKMTVQNSAENNEFVPENPNLAKVDIDPDLVADSKVLVEYKIEVMNQGSISGRVNKIVDYLTDEFEFDSSLNPDWYQDNDGNIYTRALENQTINPNETKEISLILIKNMNEDNTGLVHNTFEIADAINDKGIADIDSTPGNKLQEDDLDSVDVIIGVATGLRIGIVPAILVAIVILIPLAFLVWKIIDERRYV